MIAIMVENQPKRDAKNKTTLVVVPSSIIQQWLEEIAKHTDDGIMESVTIYKSGSRILANDPCKELRKYSVVITTYHEVSSSPLHLSGVQQLTSILVNEELPVVQASGAPGDRKGLG